VSDSDPRADTALVVDDDLEKPFHFASPLEARGKRHVTQPMSHTAGESHRGRVTLPVSG
jgi:hypothetical protein